MKIFLLGVFIVLAVAGCGQIHSREAVGIGWHTDELNLSPCACLRVWNG